MEGDAVLSCMDSLWFYSSVFLRPSSTSTSKHKESERAEEPQQDSAEPARGGGPCQIPKCAKEAAAQAGQRRAEGGGMVRTAAARGCGEWDERMVAWHKEQRRRALVAAAARCSQSQSQATMPPPPGEGLAMKAHLRSWAHAVACSVR